MTIKRKGKLNDREKKHCATLKIDIWPPNLHLLNLRIEAYVLAATPIVGGTEDGPFATQHQTHTMRWKYGRKIKTGLEFQSMSYSAQSHKHYNGQLGFKARDFFHWDVRYSGCKVECELEDAFKSAKKINSLLRLYHTCAPYRSPDTAEFIAGFADAVGAAYFYFPSNPCTVDEIKDTCYHAFDATGWRLLKRTIEQRLEEFHGPKVEEMPERVKTLAEQAMVTNGGVTP